MDHLVGKQELKSVILSVMFFYLSTKTPFHCMCSSMYSESIYLIFSLDSVIMYKSHDPYSLFIF